MKRLLGILSIAILLSGCSAQRRLEYLMKHHPELRLKTDTVLVPVKVVLPACSAAVDISWSEALGDSMRAGLPIIHGDSTNADTPQTFSVVSDHAKATVLVTDSGLTLIAEQLSDTIDTEAPAEVPIVEVHDLPVEESGIRIFFRYLGYCTAGIVFLLLVVFIVKRFI